MENVVEMVAKCPDTCSQHRDWEFERKAVLFHGFSTIIKSKVGLVKNQIKGKRSF
jgi:hypothetical protein